MKTEVFSPPVNKRCTAEKRRLNIRQISTKNDNNYELFIIVKLAFLFAVFMCSQKKTRTLNETNVAAMHYSFVVPVTGCVV